MREIFGMRSKTEAIQHLKAYVARAETELQRKVKYIRLDSAAEFHSDAMSTWAKDKGTQLEYTTPYTPEQNGIAERGMRTILDGTRSNTTSSIQVCHLKSGRMLLRHSYIRQTVDRSPH
jgi:transposase InsO family protein